jgi:hypothetical protein
MVLIEGQQKAPAVFDGWGLNTFPYRLNCISQFDGNPSCCQETAILFIDLGRFYGNFLGLGLADLGQV